MEAAAWVLLPLLLGWCLGTLTGARAVNASWAISASESQPGHRTPHCYRGRFYFVIPEGEFVREYVHRQVAASQDQHQHSEETPMRKAVGTGTFHTDEGTLVTLIRHGVPLPKAAIAIDPDEVAEIREDFRHSAGSRDAESVAVLKMRNGDTHVVIDPERAVKRMIRRHKSS